MATPAEDAKTKIVAIVRDLDEANRNALFEAVGETLSTRPKAADSPASEVKKCKGAMQPGFIILTGVLLPAALIIAWCVGKEPLVTDIDSKMLLTLLGFVVALAAYLASVAREIVKGLGALVKTGPNYQKDNKKLRLNIAWTTTAEIQLVVVGLLIFLRIVMGTKPFIPTPLISEPIPFDNIIVIYLGLILVLLAVMHVRIWVSQCPFRKIGN